MTATLPAGYESLEPFADRFAVSGTAARAALRGDTTPEERAAFHAAASGLVGQALDQRTDQLTDGFFAAVDGNDDRQPHAARPR